MGIIIVAPVVIVAMYFGYCIWFIETHSKRK
jgi:hypothetical protein